MCLREGLGFLVADNICIFCGVAIFDPHTCWQACEVLHMKCCIHEWKCFSCLYGHSLFLSPFHRLPLFSPFAQQSMGRGELALSFMRWSHPLKRDKTMCVMSAIIIHPEGFWQKHVTCHILDRILLLSCDDVTAKGRRMLVRESRQGKEEFRRISKKNFLTKRQTNVKHQKLQITKRKLAFGR